MRKIIIINLVALASSFSFGQGYNTIAFYNVENLFDTLDTEGKDDAEFLPNGKMNWDSPKYTEKLNHINTVLNDLCDPVIIGLCEIENKQVVQDIVSHGKMQNRYDIVHFESEDNRGIDNALIYDSTKLKLVDSGFLRFSMPEGDGPTRDIIWAKFNVNNETFYAMVNHWPSRRGGSVESEPKRLTAAYAAREFIDSLLTIDKNSKIVFMGDLNDYPENIAPQLIAEKLQPMINSKSGEFGGSHNYQGNWDVLDHIFVSPGFSKGKSSKIVKKSGKIHSFPYLLTEYKGNIVPNRTYGGGNYLGGYSDHLPVTIEIKF